MESWVARVCGCGGVEDAGRWWVVCRWQHVSVDDVVGRLRVVFESHPLRYRVPAASVAVVSGGEVGTAMWGAVPGTVFQAASISKPVAALRLVADGRLGLDTDVNDVLRSWQLPAPAGWPVRVTVRQVLCHGGAVTVGSYPGYPAGAVLPSLVQVLEGRAPANTSPVRVTGVPGLSHRHSGGGYVLLQQLLQDVTGVAYADLVTDLVFGPAGMTTAGFALPVAGRAASGHAPDPQSHFGSGYCGGRCVCPVMPGCMATSAVRWPRAAQSRWRVPGEGHRS